MTIYSLDDFTLDRHSAGGREAADHHVATVSSVQHPPLEAVPVAGEDVRVVGDRVALDGGLHAVIRPLVLHADLQPPLLVAQVAREEAEQAGVGDADGADEDLGAAPEEAPPRPPLHLRPIYGQVELMRHDSGDLDVVHVLHDEMVEGRDSHGGAAAVPGDGAAAVEEGAVDLLVQLHDVGGPLQVVAALVPASPHRGHDVAADGTIELLVLLEAVDRPVEVVAAPVPAPLHDVESLKNENCFRQKEMAQ